MPIYTYVCKDCNEKFDVLVGVTSNESDIKCPKCGSKNINMGFGKFSVGSSDSAGGSCPTGTCGLQ